MSNNNSDILNEIIKQFGIEKATYFCQIAASMYDIKYNAVKEQHPLTEYDFERRWWSEAYIELKKEIIL